MYIINIDCWNNDKNETNRIINCEAKVWNKVLQIACFRGGVLTIFTKL